MPESFVVVNVPSSAGKKMKTFETVDGGANVVESEAVVLVDAVTGLPVDAATATKQDQIIANLETLNSLAPTKYDYIELTYVGDNIATVVYKLGGAGGVIVSTLTLAYAGSNLISVTKT